MAIMTACMHVYSIRVYNSVLYIYFCFYDYLIFDVYILYYDVCSVVNMFFVYIVTKQRMLNVVTNSIRIKPCNRE